MAKGVEGDIAKFVAKYTPEVARQIRATRSAMRRLIPRGHEMVYDNYNSLVFGFSPTARPSDALVSLAAMPQWVTLCFIQGVKLKDPKQRLRGEGSQVRHVRLMNGAADLEDEEILALIDQALAPRSADFSAAQELTTVIRSVSGKQRPRRPAPKQRQGRDR